MSLQSVGALALAELSDASIRSLRIDKALAVAEKLATAAIQEPVERRRPLDIVADEEKTLEQMELELEHLLDVTGGKVRIEE